MCFWVTDTALPQQQQVAQQQFRCGAGQAACIESQVQGVEQYLTWGT